MKEEFAIGEEFQLGLKRVKVCNREEMTCEGCVFENIECDNFYPLTGECSSEYRSDGKSVIFEEVKQ